MAREEETQRLPRKIGEYEILEEIGRGGMGTVYRAREPRLGRVVALKVLHSSPGMGAAAVRELGVRFEREASQTARLAHPNIIPVFDYGEADGFRFFTMPLIDGGSLSQLVARRGPLPAAEGFRIVLPLASALAHAHREGVVHRDIKPSNILLDKEGNPMLVDFGLVKGRADATELTTAGTILGTPQFMSPEQASGDSSVVDERSDLYSLGAVLFFLLTGTDPPPHRDARPAVRPHAGLVSHRALGACA
ncbi:MAG: serine/threonine protein kinase [Planctomycetes bacterium]|nr:serine/threonine protein kinase [Planctomycetota bacterium]